VKILVISAAYPPMQAGEATNAYHLCQHLADRGLDVHVLTSVGNTAAPDPRITVHPLMRRWSWAEVPRFARVLRQCSPDAICMMYLGWVYNRQFMSTFAPSIAKAVCPGVPFVTRFENISGAFPAENSHLSRVIRKGVALCDSRGGVHYQFGTLLRDSDSIILLSGRHQAFLEAEHAGVGDRCVLIPPPVNMKMSPDHVSTRDRGRQLLGATAGDFVLAYIGFLYPGKGIETLLRAFARAGRTRANLRLAIVGGALDKSAPHGPGYIEELHSLARTLAIDEKVVWTGDYSFDSDEASVYLRAADACVLPFDKGVKLNNSSFSSAAAHGLPIITTADDGVEPQFEDRQNVMLCRPQSDEALAAVIDTVVDDGELRHRLRAGSLQLANQWFLWDTAIDRTLALLKGSRPSAPVDPGASGASARATRVERLAPIEHSEPVTIGIEMVQRTR
jgi:glycosyltransferase involved in cell wall biosynthesis